MKQQLRYRRKFMRYSKQTKKLASKIKETTGLNAYDINDMYTHMAYHLTQELIETGKITLAGIGTIKIKKPYTRTWYSKILQKEIESTTRPMLSIKPAPEMREALRVMFENQEIEETMKDDEDDMLYSKNLPAKGVL